MDLNIHKKFEIYNSLFLKLSYQGANDFAHLIPILGKVGKQKLLEGQDPITTFNQFYDDYKEIIQIEKKDFMFRVIQYVERQIVLFDSIEDSISPYELEDQKSVLIDSMFGQLDSEKDKKEFMEKLNAFSVRIVLTAHPTQFYRPAVLEIISKLRECVKNNDIDKIDQLLHQLGLTSLVNTASPTPLKEANNIIHICRHEYYDAIGNLIYQLEKDYPEYSNDDLVTLGFWPCGDRDGNPFVTHEVTKEVIDNLRMTLMKCYYNDLKELSSKLTFRDIDTKLEEARSSLYNAMFDAKVDFDYTQLLESLNTVKKILVSDYQSLYLEDLEKLIVKVKVFKNHFASLDIRQDHSVHRVCVEDILINKGIIDKSLDELKNDRLVELLTKENIQITDFESYKDLTKDTLLNIQQLPLLQNKNGEKGCHRYIISNSEDEFSVLFVYGLFRWIHNTDLIHFDIVPLFETMKGMTESTKVMSFLYENKSYFSHLEKRKKKQTIMLGFSDGTKDGGYLKANWSIYKCKEALSKTSKKFDIDVVFFDGRGGPPARGGGKTHNFYAARSSEIANNDIQLTIQGQTITSTYGTKEKFVFNAEQMVTSGLISLDKNSETEISDEERALIERLSELSFKKYTALKNHPMFLPYLEKMTTLKYYGQTKIGSRPGKRNKSKKLSLSDLRAISYVGSWSQLKQNIPGYYGVGTALKKLEEEGKLEEMQKLYSDVALFKTLIDNSMMSLTKCFFELTSYMKNNDEFGAFWNVLFDEYLLSKSMILQITGMDSLMENEQRSRESISLRDTIVLPLLLIQHYALQILNSGLEKEHQEIYQKLVVRSLYGNINASRNSA